MKLNSFRIKLALLAVGLSGLVLAAFAISAWVLLSRLNLERLDREIRGWGHRDLARPQPPGRWSEIAEAMRFALGEDTSGNRRFIMLVKNRANSVIYVSPDWPEAIPHSAFPPPAGRNSLRFDEDRPPFHFDGDLPPPGFDDDRRDASGRTPPRPPLVPWAMHPDPPPGDRGRFSPEGDRHGPFPTGPAGGKPDPSDWYSQQDAIRSPITGRTFRTWKTDNEDWRIGTLSTPDVMLAIGVSLDEFTASMRRMRNAFLFILPGMLLVIAIGSWGLAQRALRPVNELSATVERVTAQGLDQRVPYHDADMEFTRLISVFNQMLERLERSFRQAIRFSADAAHELKTPLTVLQGRIEQAMQHAVPGSEHEQILGELSEEVQRLKIIVQRLLLLARADSGQLSLQLQDVDLSDLVQNLAEDVTIMAPYLTIRTELAPDVTAIADINLIRQAFHNLADNAVKHNCENGWIEFTLQHSDREARLSIANSAEDIPVADRERIFDRFYRADPAHSRQVDGTGLGLSLAREIVRAHKGTLVLDRSADGVTVFSVTLPLTPPEAVHT